MKTKAKQRILSLVLAIALVFSNFMGIGKLNIAYAAPGDTAGEAISVAQAIANNTGSARYVVGYIVGTTASGPVYTQSGTFTVATNLAIADSPTETDKTKIMPVELPTGAVRTALNLKDNPGNLGKKIILKGNLQAYFSVPGLKGINEYSFVTETPTTPDTTAPVITHTPVASGNIVADLKITATVTDDRTVQTVKLYYRTKGDTAYKTLNMSLASGVYSATVLKAELNAAGLEYYIQASDGTNSATSPADINSPYQVSISTDGVPVSSISLSSTTSEVEEGKTITLTASVVPAEATNKNVVWASANTSIATVANGVVTGVTPGTVKITATSVENPAIIAECTVTVKPMASMAISDVRAMAEGTKAAVQGIVTFKDTTTRVYIQDGTAAIVIDAANLTGLPSLSVGDEIKVTGTTSTYSGLKSIKPLTGARVEKLSSGNTLPLPKDVTLADTRKTQYESQRVRIVGGKVGVINTADKTPLFVGKDSTVIFKIPVVPGLEVDDRIDLTAIASKFTATNGSVTYQLRVNSASDIVKIDDVNPPVIVPTQLDLGYVGPDLEISAVVTDETRIDSVKLYYRMKGQANYLVSTMALFNGQYVFTLPENVLSVGTLQYYIEAADKVNNVSTSPADKTNPYEVSIIDIDIHGPVVEGVTPGNGQETGDNVRPVISGKFIDDTGIDTASIVLSVDGTNVTSNATVNAAGFTYTPSNDLAQGFHTVKVEVKDNSSRNNPTVFEWQFYVGKQVFNFYYGQLHSHTALSDGIGTPAEAFDWAKNNAKADFLAITDHSNWFDNEADRNNETLTDYKDSTSTEWKQLRDTADAKTENGKFVAIGAFEMTWSGSTGGWGHINTFNTPWFSSRTNSAMDLKAYYAKLAQPENVNSINQLNHPGKTFGDFADFGYYSEGADKVVNLIEVGNGEGPIRSSGYFPSYEYYTRALDKGWHVAPTNNQDNHKGAWISANTARTVVIASDLTRASLYDAMSKKRVYATEDENIRMMYKVNGNIMGSTLNNPEKLDFSIEINDPDSTDVIGKVSIIANGGVEVISKTFDTNTANWDFSLDPKYTYYYVRVDQADKDIAVSAPVWTGDVVPVGISKVEVSQDPQIINESVDVTATVYNNGSYPLSDVKVEFFKNEIASENKIGEATIPSIVPAEMGTAKITWAPNKVGNNKIYAQAVVNVKGKTRVLFNSVVMEVRNPEDVVKVVIDGGHYNQYVSGDYKGKMETLKGVLKDKKYMATINLDYLTAKDLENAKVLVLTDPQSKNDVTNGLLASKYSDSEIQVIKDFVANGGSIIVASRADYNEKGVTDRSYESSVQANVVLEAIGSNLRINDDEVVDYTSNGGQEYRLYFDQYTSSKYNLTDGIPAGRTYSFYSGCSVILKPNGDDTNVDWLVKGHATTATLDSDLQNDITPVAMGDVNAAAAEVLPNGSKVIVAGSTFFSDFETATGDDAYSNSKITDNVIKWMAQPKPAELKTIKDLRVDADKDGVPDLLGKRFAVEGIVTAQSEAIEPKNSFFEVIYVQDATGGMTVFGVSTTMLPLGTKVRVTGYVDQYDGDAELQIVSEAQDIQILDTTPSIVEPTLMKTADSMLEENEGLLVKVQGVVKRIVNGDGDNSLYIDDGSGEAKVYVNGYIGDGSGDNATKGKWDSTIKVGDTVSAIGLASEDAAGHRIRVRNTTEIVQVASCVAGVILDRTTVGLLVGETTNLIADVKPFDATNKNVTWKSENEEVATVDADGKVTAVKAGTATIVVTTEDGSFTAECTVTVTQPVTGVSLDKTTAGLKVGETLNLAAQVNPIDATNKNVTWKSENEEVATVDADGKVTAVKAGTATIVVTTVDGSFTAECTVTVTQPVTGVSLDKTTAGLKVGETLNLAAQVNPIDATNKNVTWKSENEAVATVDANGVVTAVKAGTATIVVTTVDGSLTAECTVTVTQPVTGVALDKTTAELREGETLNLAAQFNPSDSTNKNVTWKSLNEAVATVDATGRVTAVKAGTAKIVVTTEDGSFKAECTVTVKEVVVVVPGVDDKKLDEEISKAISSGKTEVEIVVTPVEGQNEISVVIPMDSFNAAKENNINFVVNEGNYEIVIPSGLVDLSNYEGGKLKFTREALTGEEVKEITSSQDGLVLAGNAIELNLTVLSKEGTAVGLHNFAGKVKVSIKLTQDDINGKDVNKLAAYYYNLETKKWEMISGGKFDKETMTFTFETNHFSTFAVMENTVTPASNGDNLPKTGDFSFGYTPIALTLMAVGGILVFIRRRREQ